MSILVKRLFVLFVILVASFSAQADEKAQVVKSFKSLAAGHIASFKTDNRAWVVTQSKSSTTPPFESQILGYINVWFSVLPEYGIDIQVSNSLMSPYTGTLDYKVQIHSSQPHQTREEAAKDFTEVEVSRAVDYRNTYAYQDGEWVLVSKKSESLGRWSDAKKP